LHQGIGIGSICDPQVADEPVVRLVQVGRNEGTHVGNLGDGQLLDLSDYCLTVECLLLVREESKGIVGQGHLSTLLARVLSGTAFDTVPI
jgi:hypothetical protein